MEVLSAVGQFPLVRGQSVHAWTPVPPAVLPYVRSPVPEAGTTHWEQSMSAAAGPAGTRRHCCRAVQRRSRPRTQSTSTDRVNNCKTAIVGAERAAHYSECCGGWLGASRAGLGVIALIWGRTRNDRIDGERDNKRDAENHT